MLTVYSKANCPYCELAKSWLDSNKIPYETINVSDNDTALTLIKDHGHKTVPQIYLNGEVFVEGGWDGLKNTDPAVLREQIELNDLRGN